VVLLLLLLLLWLPAPAAGHSPSHGPASGLPPLPG
jgi:hypothetical protein